ILRIALISCIYQTHEHRKYLLFGGMLSLICCPLVFDLQSGLCVRTRLPTLQHVIPHTRPRQPLPVCVNPSHCGLILLTRSVSTLL
uniref:Uncharacterized protein n=1 Tax=Oreochromis aureus TaxID=47969 RepID=A0AAZ1WWA1_OREAU